MGIIRMEPMTVPIARPLAHDGRMYQSFILISFFMIL